MPRKLDPAIADILKHHGFGPDACWDCHGTWVVYHRVLEQIAAKTRVKFDMPKVLEADGETKCAALCVLGHLGDREEWSIGEAAPGNNKNNYPYAMAEKRAKDRVILKLIGLHGLVYSEDEMPSAEPPAATVTAVHDEADKPTIIGEPQATKTADGLIQNIDGCISGDELNKYIASDAFKTPYATLPQKHRERVFNAGKTRRAKIETPVRMAG